MKKIKIELDHFNVVYGEATPEGKIAIGRLVGKEYTDPYIQACMKLGMEPEPELDETASKDKIWADAGIRLSTCIRAYNLDEDGNEWVKVYDGTERHWYPIPDLSSGFGFSSTDCDNWYATSNVGSRFEYRTSDGAKDGFEKFNKYYKIYITQ